ncbi:MAG TPA: glycosyltransferase [Gemmatimonadota bacterium]|nr:glycosyltransferase [Gemmatimonadota bacterium]
MLAVNDMGSPRVSVLLPCRDAQEHLPLAIRGLKLQTFRDYEVVAVNDGSADGTGEVLERWAAGDERVRVLHQERRGLAEALRVGAAECRGALLARVDADDLAHGRRLAEQVSYLDRHPDVAAIGTRVRYFPHGQLGWGARRYERWLNSLVNPDQLARDIFVECPIAHPTLMVRRSRFKAVGGYSEVGWAEDYDLILRLHLAGAQLANVPAILHFWRERDDRASRVDPRYSAQAFRRCKIHYLRQAELNGRGSVSIWGAGRVGKDFARALGDEGVTVEAFFDIDPRKIGQEIYGAAVHDARDAQRLLGSYLLVAVGAAGARELIREELDGAGLQEGAHYRCVA